MPYLIRSNGEGYIYRPPAKAHNERICHLQRIASYAYEIARELEWDPVGRVQYQRLAADFAAEDRFLRGVTSDEWSEKKGGDRG